MKSLTRYETIGITTAIIIASVLLGVASLFPFHREQIQEEETEQSGIVSTDPRAENKEAALVAAIREASNPDGRVLKLVVHDLSVGKGRKVKIGDTVTVQYIGMAKDGPEFDNSYKKGGPISFKVGMGEVIEGWEQGIIGMKEGGKRILVVPPALGYGNNIVDPIPANATLIFSIELLSIE